VKSVHEDPSKGIDMNHTPLTTDEQPRRGTRTAALGVTAGLLGGGAIGLVMTVPSLTSAASDDGSGAAVVALQDDGSTEVPADGERPEPGERLRELLQPLVDDATITADQADAVTEHLVENRPERDHHRRHHRGPGRDGEVVAGLLGIDVETLRAELEAGNSLADIAAANGIDVQSVVDALVDEAAAHLELAVDSGRLTDDEAADRLARITERIEGGVDRVPGQRG
jgi:hypothetical protein